MEKKEKINNAIIAALKAAAYFGVYFAAQLIASFIFAFIFGLISALNGVTDPNEIANQILSYSMELTLISNVIAIFGCIGLSIVFKKNEPLAEKLLDINVNFDKRWIVLGVCFALGIFGQFAISFILNLIPFPQSWIELLNQNSEIILNSSIFMQVLSVAIMAPIAEEIIFRACIQGTLSKGMPKWVAIIVASLIFGVMHANPIGIIYATALGILMGWIYASFDSIIPSMLFHFAFNLMSLFISEEVPIIFLIISVIIFLVCIGYLIYLIRSKRQDNNDINNFNNDQGDNDNEAL